MLQLVGCYCEALRDYVRSLLGWSESSTGDAAKTSAGAMGPQDDFFRLTTTPSRYFLAQGFAEDARTLSGIELQKFKDVIDGVAHAAGFMDFARFEGIAQEAGVVDKSAVSALHTVLQVAKVRSFDEPLSDEQILDAMERAARWHGLDQGELTALRERVEYIQGVKAPGLGHQKVAESLAGATGAVLLGHRFVCDARPVFADDGEDVLGMVPIVTLRIRAQELPADIETVIDVVLTERDMAKMIENVTSAQSQIRALKRLLGTKEIDIPKVRGHQDEQEEELIQ